VTPRRVTDSPPAEGRPSPIAGGGAEERVTADLVGVSVRSGFARLGSQGGQVLLFVGSGVVLARLLTPGDFGIFAMVTSLTTFVAAFRDFGLQMAMLQGDQVEERDVNALFWVALRLNLLTALFVCAMAPVLGWFYGESRLVPVTLVMAGAIFLLGLTYVHESLLMRRMRFGTLSLIDLGALAASVLVGIASALLGTGYWALVHQSVVFFVVRSMGLWLACDWKPKRRASRRRSSGRLRELLWYGSEFTAYRVLNYIGNHLSHVLIGYFGGATALGLYQNAFRWARYPLLQIYAPLQSVAVAALSRVRQEAGAFRAAVRQAFLPLYALVMPLLAFMFAEASNVILVLLGGQWRDAIPLFRVLCVAALAGTVLRALKWVYLAEGRTRRQLAWALISTPVMVLGVVVGIRWGAFGVAVGFTIASCALLPPAIAFCIRGSRLRMRDFLAPTWRPALSSTASAALLVLFQPRLPSGAPPLELGIGLVVFSMAYVGSWMAVPGGMKAAADVLRLLGKLRPSSHAGRTVPRGAR